MNSVWTSLVKIWALCKKNISIYFKRPPVIIFGLFFPFFVALSWVIGRDLTPTLLFIGIISMTSFFTATSMSPVVMPIETREKSLERIMVSPTTLMEILFGIVFASSIYSFLITSIITFLFLFIFLIEINSVFTIIIIFLGIALMAILGSLLGFLVSSVPTDMNANVMIIMNIIKFPLLFVSGIFIPLDKLPENALIFSFFSPMTYLVDLLRFDLKESNYFTYQFNIIMLFLWILILFIMSYYLHKKTLLKRFSLGSK